VLNPNFRDALSAFTAERVEYLLVGAFAMTAYGLPRATGDIDLWVRPTRDNAERVWRALVAFGAPAEMFEVSDFAAPEAIPVLGREHLLRNKRATGRAKDRLDAEILERTAARAGRSPETRGDAVP
jgi:hypothetical protein